MKIAIVLGGASSEKGISILTGLSVAEALVGKYDTEVIHIGSDISILPEKLLGSNVVFNALHGRFGEDGYVQTILETAKVKYTHSGVIASYIAMDKEISKKLFLKNKIITPKYLKYKFNKNSSIKKK